MDSRKPSFTFILVLSFGAFLLSHHFACSKDFRREVICYDDTLHVDCGNLSFIAVHEAYYTSDVTENVTCQAEASTEDVDNREAHNHTTCDEDIRISVNRRCSGFNSCNYSYSSEPERMCTDQRGVFVVRYDCVRGSTMNKYCNTKLHAREGYISSPGYPVYYPAFDNCEWSLEASEGQTILLKVLHLHLRAPTEVGPSPPDQDTMYALGQLVSEPVTKCDMDALTVLEGDMKRFQVCGEGLQALKTIEAEGSTGLTVRIKSLGFMPASGFLAYFKVQGCPTLVPSEGSKLEERNGSAAVYSCSSQNVFNDTLESTRFLHCVRDHHWNDTLPPCVAMEELTTTTATTTIISANKSIEVDAENVTAENIETPLLDVQFEPSFMEDILIPSILIGILLIGNAIIVGIIISIRRRHKSNSDEEEELNQTKSQPMIADIKDV